MACRFFRRSGSRASIRNPVRRNGCFGERVSRETLCPLGQPEKVIGRESQTTRIDPNILSNLSLLYRTYREDDASATLEFREEVE
jgi:hypothetical protein